MDLRSRPSGDEPPPESVRVLPPEAGTTSAPLSSRPQSRPSMAGPVVLLVAVLVAGGAGLLYGYSLGDDEPSEADAEAAVATSIPATVPPTSTAPATPFPTIESPFTPAGRGHLVPEGATEWLNANTVYAVAMHPDGTLWSVGPGGVVQWSLDDGTYVRHTTTDGTGPVGVHDLAIADDGEVWVIGRDRISHWDGEEWGRQHRLQAGRAAFLTSIAATADGSVWVGSVNPEREEFGLHRGTDGFGQDVESYDVGAEGANLLRSGPGGALWAVVGGDLWQLADERWTQATDTGFRWINEIAAGPDGEVLIVSEGSVSRWHQGSLTPINDDGQPLVNHALDGFIQWITIDAADVPWIAARSFGDEDTTELIRLDDLTRYPVPAEFPSRPVAAADGTLWMGTEDGIIGFTDGSWTRLRVDGGDAPLQWPQSMAVDGNGTLWMAGGDEIASFDGETWDVLGADELVQEPAVGNRREGPAWVTAGPDGGLWAGIGCQAATLRGGEWVPMGGPADIERAGFCWAADRAVGDDGSLFLIVEASVESARGVHRWDGTSWAKVADIDPTIGLLDIDIGADGTLWGSSQRALLRLEDGGWTTVFGGLEIGAIAASADGSIWVAEPCWWCPGDSGGIWRFNDGSWTREMELRVSSMVASADGTLWAIGQNAQNQSAAWHYEAGRFRPVLNVEPFTAVAAGPDGSGWLASQGRLVHIPGS